MLNIKIYNTLTRKKDVFEPVVPGRVSMYVCGVTVYDYSHIGHGRAYVVFDTIRRYLEYAGYAVTYVQNFTDIDDKIIERSRRENTDWKLLSERFIQEYFRDMDALHIERAAVYPKATEHIPEMLAMIEQLIGRGVAYVVNGDVYFSIDSCPAYGRLSGRSLDDMQAGARVEVDYRKQHPMDFALWKKSAEDEPGWESPWGRGRPGWHIECSAMSVRYLGQPFDIHGGGADLVFPHHENEIAQAECATDKQFARYWIHNGFVNVNQEKMSKSLGNFFTIREVLKQYQPEELRLFYLTTHYRKPINYSLDQLSDARKGLERLYNALFLEHTSPQDLKSSLDQFRVRFEESMADDFNTAQALGVLFELSHYIHKTKDSKAQQLLRELGNVLGILYKEQQEKVLDREIEQLIEQRQEARKNRDFVTADRVRDQLAGMGILLEDTPQGPRWKRVQEDL